MSNKRTTTTDSICVKVKIRNEAAGREVLPIKRSVSRNMVRINPFCDSDFRNGLQFLAGVNLMMCGIALIIDILAVAEVSHFFAYWSHEELKLSPSTAELLLVLDMLIISFQIFYGLKLYKAVSENAYSKIRRWKFPSVLLLLTRLLTVIIYIIAMPSSPYYYYFTSITLVYSAFIFWPVRLFLSEIGSIPITENSRLLICVN